MAACDLDTSPRLSSPWPLHLCKRDSADLGQPSSDSVRGTWEGPGEGRQRGACRLLAQPSVRGCPDTLLPSIWALSPLPKGPLGRSSRGQIGREPVLAERAQQNSWALRRLCWKGVARLALGLRPVSTLDSGQHPPGARLAPLPLPQGSSSNSTAPSRPPGPAHTGRERAAGEATDTGRARGRGRLGLEGWLGHWGSARGRRLGAGGRAWGGHRKSRWLRRVQKSEEGAGGGGASSCTAGQGTRSQKQLAVMPRGLLHVKGVGGLGRGSLSTGWGPADRKVWGVTEGEEG